jgi:hypothetical protein
MAAVQLASELKREVGILRAQEYAAWVFQVIRLPQTRNRYGLEVHAEVVGVSGE